MNKKTEELKPHPQNVLLYDAPTGPEWVDFLASIKTHGIMEPLLIRPDDVIISGHRRWQAAKELGILEVPCNIITPDNETDELFKLVEANRYRKKKVMEIMREAALLESLEKKLGFSGSKGFGWNQQTPPGRSKERIAEALGIGSHVTYDKMKKVFEAAKTIPYVKTVLAEVDSGKKSINAAWEVVRKITYPAKEGPGFELKCYNVWTFSQCDPALGISHPGRIPGQVVQNLLWYYTNEGDFVVDPFAGGGISIDACSLSNRKCLALDIAPVREDIIQWDISKGYPPEAKDANLIFADPPYFNVLEDEYKALSTETAAGLSYEDFKEFLANLVKDSHSTLAPGGHFALLIMPQFMKLPEGLTDGYIDWPVMVYNCMKEVGFKMVKRIIQVWPTSIYNAMQVSAAKEKKSILPISGDIIVGQKR